MNRYIKNIFIIVIILSVLLGAKYIGFQDVATSVEGAEKNSHKDFLNLLVKMANSVIYDKNAEEFHKFLAASLEQFEIDSLYNSKFVIGDEKERWVTYSGKNLPNEFRLSLPNKPLETITIQNFGDFKAKYSLKKNSTPSFKPEVYTSSRSYSGFLQVEQNSGEFSYSKIVILLDSILKVLDPSNITNIETVQTKYFNDVTDIESRKLIDLFANEFPELIKLTSLYVKVNSVVSKQETEKQAITKVNLKANLILSHIKMDYSYLGNYLDEITDLGNINILITNEQGNRVAEISLNSSNLGLELITFTKNGKLIPYSSGIVKKNFPDQGFQFSNQNQKKLITQISFNGNIYGLKISNPSILAGIELQTAKQDGKLQVSLSKINRTKVSGGFSYVIPSWLINLFIPGNMEELIYEFTSLLVHANANKGSFAKTIWKKTGKANTIEARIETELLDNFFIGFGLKIWNFKVAPNEEARKEITKIIAKVLNSIKNSI
ncbi:MAG: hypothetical protein SFU98_10265 [Leptospiraceae bacterium]|nr:hypothetical protein [Leptospiraceae bacterium]